MAAFALLRFDLALISHPLSLYLSLSLSHTHTHTHIHRERERARETETDIHTHVYRVPAVGGGLGSVRLDPLRPASVCRVQGLGLRV